MLKRPPKWFTRRNFYEFCRERSNHDFSRKDGERCPVACFIRTKISQAYVGNYSIRHSLMGNELFGMPRWTGVFIAKWDRNKQFIRPETILEQMYVDKPEILL